MYNIIIVIIFYIYNVFYTCGHNLKLFYTRKELSRSLSDCSGQLEVTLRCNYSLFSVKAAKI